MKMMRLALSMPSAISSVLVLVPVPVEVCWKRRPVSTMPPIFTSAPLAARAAAAHASVMRDLVKAMRKAPDWLDKKRGPAGRRCSPVPGRRPLFSCSSGRRGPSKKRPRLGFRPRFTWRPSRPSQLPCRRCGRSCMRSREPDPGTAGRTAWSRSRRRCCPWHRGRRSCGSRRQEPACSR